MKTAIKTSLLALALFASFGASATIIEIGAGATAYEGDIAIGDNSEAQYGTAFGTNASAIGGSGCYAMAFGVNATSSCIGAGRSSISMGFGANSNWDAIAIGDLAVANHGVAVGNRSYAGDGAAAFGNNSRAESLGSVAINGQATGGGYVAIGGNAQATAMSAVAIAGRATAINAQAFGGYSGAENATSLGFRAVADQANTVSVGRVGEERRIVNVAFGTGNSDVVVVGQVVPAINGLVSGLGGGTTYDATTGVLTGPNYPLSVGTFNNVGDALAALDGALGGGTPTPNRYFKADGMNDGSDDAEASGDYSVAGGALAKATNYGTTAQGSMSEASGDSASAFGHQAKALADQSTALGAYASAIAGDCVSLGYASVCDQASTVSVGQVGAERRITNVADGADPKDAVNMGQLNVVDMKVNDTRNSLAESMNYIGDGASYNPVSGVMTAPTINFMDGSTHNDISGALHNLDGRVNDLESAPPGSGPAGPAGADGDSAYQVALNNGFTGSEAEWLDSLKGEQGERGEQGVPGEPGTGSTEPGPPGEDGVDGVDGRSAYEVAIENGFEGTEEEWLASLEGVDGRDGVDGKDGAGKKLIGGSNIAVSDNEDGTQTASLKDNVELSDQGSVKVGATTVNAQGVSIAGGPSMTTKGIDAGHQRVTSVAAGRIEQGSMDAANGGQLWELDDRWNDRWTQTNDRIDGLGAQLGAFGNMANTPGSGGLGVGVGFSGSKAALAIGWSKRINDKVSISVGAAFGGGNRPVYGMGIRIGGTP